MFYDRNVILKIMRNKVIIFVFHFSQGKYHVYNFSEFDISCIFSIWLLIYPEMYGFRVNSVASRRGPGR